MLINYADSSSEIRENLIIMKTYHFNSSEPPASDLGFNRYCRTPKMNPHSAKSAGTGKGGGEKSFTSK